LIIRFASTSVLVMPGLDPGIHALLNCRAKDVDGRDKQGHDEFCDGFFSPVGPLWMSAMLP
jgi:hypothetical protein